MSVHLKPGKMPYRYFGRSGLQTSVISLGNMINTKEETYAVDEQIIKVALENGINHFDTAEGYDNGKAETQLGKILKNLQVPREQIIVATKIRFAPIKDINSDHLISRKHIKESLNGCLQRLQMDYVDILYAHFQDDLTPVEEICRGFHEAIESGKVLYWATSNWDAEMVLNALNACERLNLHKPIGAQNEYNMLQRTENQVEYLGLYQNYQYGLVAWSPLAGGFLTGRHLQGIAQEEVNRFNDKNKYFTDEFLKSVFYEGFAKPEIITGLKTLSDLAEKELNCKLTHLAIAWAIKYNHLDSALIGARNVAQLEDSLKALEVVEKWTPELEARINKILNNSPEPRMDFKNWKPLPHVRPVAP